MSEVDRLVEYLDKLGLSRIPHAGQLYVDHCSGVYHGLKAWGYDERACKAGFFHSIYGTERFVHPSLGPLLRDQVKGLIGEPAEAIAYVNCAMRREEFDPMVLGIESNTLTDRFFLQKVELDWHGFVQSLCAVHLCDWLDQVPHSFEWGYRRQVYATLAIVKLGGAAREAYEWVFRGR